MTDRTSASSHLNSGETTVARFTFSGEQQLVLRDSLVKTGIRLHGDGFLRLVQDIEITITLYQSEKQYATDRAARDALRKVWQLAHADDPSVGLLRARVAALPERVCEYLDRRAKRIIVRLYHEPADQGFRTWAREAKPDKLLRVVRIISADGGLVVPGRSRGAGRRSAPRVEPIVMGVVRDGPGSKPTGGAPRLEAERWLVMNLALDWLTATGQEPDRGRDSRNGFGYLVHEIFEWIGLPQARARTALRSYWALAGHW